MKPTFRDLIALLFAISGMSLLWLAACIGSAWTSARLLDFFNKK